MPFQQRGALRYYTFDLLGDDQIVQGVFTRSGGVSPKPWEGLNVGGTVGDDPQRVGENRRRLFAAMDRRLDSMYDVWQVHSDQVVIAEAPRQAHIPHLKADAILTNRPEVTLFMRFADCAPVLLYDPRQGVVGLAHAGWKGTLQRIAATAVAEMQHQFGSRPADVRAAIGPSIGGHHYPVGEEVAAAARATFGDLTERVLVPDDGRVHFDLWEANRLVLEQCGVEQIEVSQVCTACHLEDWFSHRGEGGRTGRFGALIGLR